MIILYIISTILTSIIITIVFYFKSYPKKTAHKKNRMNICLSFEFMNLFIFNILCLLFSFNCEEISSFFLLLDDYHYIIIFLFLTPISLLLSIKYCKESIKNAIEDPNIKWK